MRGRPRRGRTPCARTPGSAGSAVLWRRSRPKTAETPALAPAAGCRGAVAAGPSWALTSQQHDIGEERSRATVAAQRHLRVGDLAAAALLLELVHPARDPLGQLHDAAAMAVGHQPAVRRDRESAVRSDPAVHDAVAPFALGAEFECFELPDDFKRERVIQ